MRKIRIGCVSYLNTAPLIEGLEGWEHAEIVGAVPSRLCEMLSHEEVDLALVSVVDAVQAGGDFILLPVGMIGCNGPTLTVRLFSQVPIDSIRAVHADTDSHTSVVLMQVLLHALHGLAPDIIPFDARERVGLSSETAGEAAEGNDDGEWPETMLLIGDKVVVDSPPAVRYGHQLDLGQAWHELTGLPFVYAAWMCRSGDVDDPAVRSAVEMLDRQRRHNKTRLDWIVSERAPQRGWPADLARTYVGSSLRYEVTDAAREGLDRFLGEAKQLGLVERGEVQWKSE